MEPLRELTPEKDRALTLKAMGVGLLAGVIADKLPKIIDSGITPKEAARDLCLSDKYIIDVATRSLVVDFNDESRRPAENSITGRINFYLDVVDKWVLDNGYHPITDIKKLTEGFINNKPKVSSDSVAVVRISLGRPTVTNTLNSLARDSIFLTTPLGGVVATDKMEMLCKPFEGGIFVANNPVATITDKGNYAFIALASNFDERFANYQPAPSKEILVIIRNEGNLFVPIANVTDLPDNAAITIATSGDSLLVASLLPNRGLISLVSVENIGSSPQITRIKAKTDELFSLVSGDNPECCRVIKNPAEDGSYLWEVSTKIYDSTRYTIVRQSIDSEGNQKFDLFPPKCERKSGLSYTLLGQVDNQLAVLESSGKVATRIIFIDQGSNVTTRSVNTEVQDPQFTTLVTNGLKDNLDFCEFNSNRYGSGYTKLLTLAKE